MRERCIDYTCFQCQWLERGIPVGHGARIPDGWSHEPVLVGDHYPVFCSNACHDRWLVAGGVRPKTGHDVMGVSGFAGIVSREMGVRAIHNPAPGRTLRDWAIERTQQGHHHYCPNRSRFGEYACNCGYEMAWEQCLGMLKKAKPHVPDVSEL